MTDGKRSSTSRSRARKKTVGDYWFDEVAADRACEFFERFLVHTKGEFAGQPFELQHWERDLVIRPLFGWKRADGTRRYRSVFVAVPRKNGKTTLAAGIGLYLTFADREPGAEVYSAASDREQAAIAFEQARSMVEACPELSERALIYRRAIVVPGLGSSYKVLSADARSKHGFNAHGIIFDELHAQPNRELYDVLHTSTGARRQPVELYITTAGYDRHSICYELYEHAKKVRAGILRDDSFLPVIFEADAEDDWTAEATWRKANPNYGVSIKPEYLAAECARAKTTPGYENTFKRLHLNIWTEQSSRWLQMSTWDECAVPVDAAALRGRQCYAGLDLSTTTDISAFVLVFPDDQWRTFDALAYFWVPGERIRQRAERDRVPYPQWRDEGHIRATDGDIVDYDVIRRDINELAEQYVIREIAIDRWNATQLATQLTGDGFTVVQFGQGFASMSAPSKELEKLVTGKLLRHGGNPVLRWMASNVAIKQDAAGNIKPDKASSGERIDGIVALVMALGRASVMAQPPAEPAIIVL